VDSVAATADRMALRFSTFIGTMGS